MLVITVLGEESWDEESEEFLYPEAFELRLEHSLVSLSKWEEIHEKAFLGPQEKTTEESLHYVVCMILNEDYPDDILTRLSDEDYQQIQAYIDKKHSATWFAESGPAKKSNEVITADLIQYWMNAANIPLEWENRHLNKLITLIKIHGIKNEPPKKHSRNEIFEQNRRLNKQRREQMGTKG